MYGSDVCAGVVRNRRSREYQITAGWKPEFQLMESRLHTPAQEPFVSKRCNYKPPTNTASSAGSAAPSAARHPARPRRGCGLGRAAPCRSAPAWHRLVRKGLGTSARGVERCDTNGKGLKRVWSGHAFSLAELAFSSRVFVSRGRDQQNQALKQGLMVVKAKLCWLFSFVHSLLSVSPHYRLAMTF